MMPTLAQHPASDFSLAALADAFTAAYAGYFMPIYMTAAALDTHITTNDIALDRSLVAQAPDGVLECLALLGVRAVNILPGDLFGAILRELAAPLSCRSSKCRLIWASSA
jgi:hypothetical protein